MDILSQALQFCFENWKPKSLMGINMRKFICLLVPPDQKISISHGANIFAYNQLTN